MRCKTLKFDFSFWYGEVWKFQDSVISECLSIFWLQNMYYKIRNRMAMKEKTVHSMKIFNFSCHIENKIVTLLQLIVKNFHLRCGLIGCTMSNQWCLTCYYLFLSWCNTLVLKKIGMRCETLKFDFSFWYGEVWKFQDSVISECLSIFWLQTCIMK